MRVEVSKGKTIGEVVKDGLCTGCGTCAGICPMDAVEMVKDDSKGIYLPQLDEKKCSECGNCFLPCSVPYGFVVILFSRSFDW